VRVVSYTRTSFRVCEYLFSTSYKKSETVMQDTVFVVPSDYLQSLSQMESVHFLAPPDELNPYGPPPGVPDTTPPQVISPPPSTQPIDCSDLGHACLSLIKIPLACIMCCTAAQWNQRRRGPFGYGWY
jgi:hypothetical protein